MLVVGGEERSSVGGATLSVRTAAAVLSLHQSYPLPHLLLRST